MYLNILCIYYIICYILSTLKALNACLRNKVQREFHITMANLVLCPILGRSKTTMTNRVGVSFSYQSSWYKGEVWGWVSGEVSLSLGIALIHCRVAVRKVSSPKIPWKSSTLTNQKPLISRFLIFCETLKAYGFLNSLFSHKTKKGWWERDCVQSFSFWEVRLFLLLKKKKLPVLVSSSNPPPPIYLRFRLQLFI